MGKCKRKKGEKLVKELFDGGVCADECTGLLQRVTLNKKQLEEYHRQFNK
jgi:hypothetical protein